MRRSESLHNFETIREVHIWSNERSSEANDYLRFKLRKRDMSKCTFSENNISFVTLYWSELNVLERLVKPVYMLIRVRRAYYSLSLSSSHCSEQLEALYVCLLTTVTGMTYEKFNGVF